MLIIFQRPQILKPAQVLPVDLAVVLALAPTTARVWAGIQEQAIGVAAQLRDRMEPEIDNYINIFLLRVIAIYGMIAERAAAADDDARAVVERKSLFWSLPSLSRWPPLARVVSAQLPA